MCRHLAYLGRPASLQELLVEPAYGLVRQSWAPRRQRHGTLNADGFGVGWYPQPDGAGSVGGVAGQPLRYRRGVPIWGDATFAELAPAIRSGCVLAAVRSATPGGPGGEQACAPFLLPDLGEQGRAVESRVLLSHNGVVPIADIAPLVGSAALAAIGSTVDSAFVAALVAEQLFAQQPGAGLGAGLAAAVAAIVAVAPQARLNLLATDGVTVAATAWGDTLCWRVLPGGVVVASEPYDDQPGWTEVPDRCLLTLTGDDCVVVPLTPMEGSR